MSLDRHDPRLTSYALGELDPREAAILEAELGESPDGQRALAEIRQTSELLRAALAAEPAPALPLAARSEILAAADAAQSQPAAGTAAHAIDGTTVVHHAAPRPRPVARTAVAARAPGWLWRHRVGVVASGAVLMVVVGLLMPAVQTAREAAPLQVAMHDRAMDANTPAGSYGSFPAQQSQADGRPMPRTDSMAIAPQMDLSVQEPETQVLPADPPLVELYDPSQGNAAQQGQGQPWDISQTKPSARATGNQYPEQYGFYSTGTGKDQQWGDKVEILGERLKELRDGDRAGGQMEGGMGGGPMGAEGVAGLSKKGAAIAARPRILIIDEEKEQLLRDRFARIQLQDSDVNTNTEAYDATVENPFEAVARQPLSTFSIDVDTASYANVRRFLHQGTLPPAAAVRIEELVNYFRYDYAPPQQNEPFAAHTAVAVCPWAPTHRLVRIALKGKEIAVEDRPASNLVFLIDVSGSMRDANKLPLVKEGLRLLVEKLGENDRVAIVVYAGASGVLLPSTLGSDRQTIMQAIDQLEAGGSTNGASGIQLAYDMAVGHFIRGGANRVILATDGDFNVGVTDQAQLTQLIEKKAASGVFLSVLGFGMGNLKDGTLEKLADKGNGNYAYIDTLREARKVLVEQLSGTLVTIAKDVKIQVEFNPARVQSYRLIGYENRMLAKEDFNDDKKDAGEIGAGHTVTALYEVVPVGGANAPAGVDKLEYQTQPAANVAPPASNDLLMLKLRYKEPDGTESKLLKFPVADREPSIAAAGDDFEFAAAVAAFGMLLRHSTHQGTATFDTVRELAAAGLGADKEGYRREFIELVEKAQTLSK